MDRGAWWATVHGIAELDTIEQEPLTNNYVEKPKPRARPLPHPNSPPPSPYSHPTPALSQPPRLSLRPQPKYPVSRFPHAF